MAGGSGSAQQWASAGSAMGVETPLLFLFLCLFLFFFFLIAPIPTPYTLNPTSYRGTSLIRK